MLIIRIDIVLCGFVNEAILNKALANVTNEICFHKSIKICIRVGGKMGVPREKMGCINKILFTIVF